MLIVLFFRRIQSYSKIILLTNFHSFVFMSRTELFIICVVAINSIAYLYMIVDKLLSKSKGRRIPEHTLFLIAFLLGAVGIFLGMQLPVRHKSAKAKFKWGIPLLVAVNGVVVWFVLRTNYIQGN